MDAAKPKPPTAGAAMALAKAQAYQDAADAPSTLRAYASDLKNYQAWCETLRRRVAASARASGVASHPLDTKHPAIRETLRGIGRTHGSRGRRSAALTTSELKKLGGVCNPGSPATGTRRCSSSASPKHSGAPSWPPLMPST